MDNNQVKELIVRLSTRELAGENVTSDITPEIRRRMQKHNVDRVSMLPAARRARGETVEKGGHAAPPQMHGILPGGCYKIPPNPHGAGAKRNLKRSMVDEWRGHLNEAVQVLGPLTDWEAPIEVHRQYLSTLSDRDLATLYGVITRRTKEFIRYIDGKDGAMSTTAKQALKEYVIVE